MAGFFAFWSIFRSVVSVIGILDNALIVAVNLWDWAKGRSLNTCDRILLTLGISSALFQCIVLANMYISLKWADVFNLDYVFLVLNQLEILFSTSSFWLASCLCVFYCVKITDFNHPAFIYLKLRISKVVSWFITVSVMGSVMLAVPACWSVYREMPQNSTMNLSANYTAGGGALNWRKWNIIVNILFNFTLPLLIDILSIILILLSLLRHTQQMKENGSGFSQPRLEAHFKVAKLVGSLFLIYVFTFLAVIVMLSVHSLLVKLMGLMLINTSNKVQSVFLIMGNTKLRQVFWKVLSGGQKKTEEQAH